MDVKKSPKVDLEKKKVTFLFIGIVLTLSFVLLAFEWTANNNGESLTDGIFDMGVDDEIIPPTRQEPPPKEEPKIEKKEDIFEIVENDVEIENEVEIDDIEVDETTEVEIVEVEEEEEEDNTVFQFAVIEDKPEFPGGQKALLTYIAKNTKYPEIAKENGIKGTVFVQFVIGKNGKVSDVKPARKVDTYLDREAVRVVKSMPKWKPGKQRGKAVRVQYIVPIKFVLH